MDDFRITIHGARGSLPNPTANMIRYGGDTTCLGIVAPESPRLIIDAGTGIVDLGRSLIRAGDESRELHLLFTHIHWDHIAGLPLFLPLYDPDWTIHLYHLVLEDMDIEDVLRSLYNPLHFPVPFKEVKATLKFHELDFDSIFKLGNIRINCCRVNHPGYALGYRISHGERSIFFAGDAAPYDRILFEERFHNREEEKDPAVLEFMSWLDQRMKDEIFRSDILFFDANYTAEEYERFFHFGHSSMDYAYELALQCCVGRLVFWHHDRNRKDAELDDLIQPFIQRGIQDGLQVDAAIQNQTYLL